MFRPTLGFGGGVSPTHRPMTPVLGEMGVIQPGSGPGSRVEGFNTTALHSSRLVALRLPFGYSASLLQYA